MILSIRENPRPLYKDKEERLRSLFPFACQEGEMSEAKICMIARIHNLYLLRNCGEIIVFASVRKWDGGNMKLCNGMSD